MQKNIANKTMPWKKWKLIVEQKKGKKRDTHRYEKRKWVAAVKSPFLVRHYDESAAGWAEYYCNAFRFRNNTTMAQ